ncbi:MaoC/PaaZ C-terminal domain-containing protein [Aneurinibacillus sp. UBA3580]|jgi:hypothetical protein|uniref:MaoC/PaaZ C-terminal domain-containing protein n=1 Tax=Aneurinibacillus sp. UBA3580 TaxID=1946041 RepID=UPI00257EC3A3|nr:MaoC/PaaZ C-terminal domain-containing protein [Aneurinibacillus sp. UBA3580]
MYFEEFYTGQRFTLEPITITAEEIDEFARKYDPQPIHIDREFAEQGPFGGIIASGFHTAGVVWRQWIESGRFRHRDYRRKRAGLFALDCACTSGRPINHRSRSSRDESLFQWKKRAGYVEIYRIQSRKHYSYDHTVQCVLKSEGNISKQRHGIRICVAFFFCFIYSSEVALKAK